MLNPSDFAPLPPTSKTNSGLFVVVLGVILLHLLLLGLGTFWHPSPSPLKHRSKVVVQTVRLSSFQSEIAQHSPSLSSPASTSMKAQSLPLPIEQSKVATPLPIKEEIPTPLSNISPKEESEKIEKTESPLPVKAAPSPLPVKEENISKSKPTPPKSTPKEVPKKTPQPAAPVKKTSEPAKKVKNEITPPKKTVEAEKKRQQEEAAKKQQEQAEKKKQQEKAEADKKKQQEIAAAQKAAKQKELTLLAKAKENLAKMNETRDKISASSSVNLDSAAIPKELVSLNVDALPLGGGGGSSDWGTREASYSDEVAYRLKMALKLPDYGAVKIKLTLDRSGKVIKVVTVHSESNKNKVYVENKILTLIFPSFGQKFQGVPQNTFEITLQNDS